MDLSKHVDTVRSGIVSAASLADEHTQEVAGRLATVLDSSARLALFSAISEAATEISAELAPGSVEMRVVDGNPNFSVHLPQPAGEPTLIMPERQVSAADATAEPEVDEDEPMVRVSLRLPASVKNKVDETADAEGISTNAWLVKAIQNALTPGRQTGSTPVSSGPANFGGVFGPNGPFGPNGVFGPGGVFGDGGVFDNRARPPRPPRPPRAPRGPRGNQVKGWVR
jgi:hypothetical protein